MHEQRGGYHQLIFTFAFSVRGVVDPQQTLLRYLRLDEADTYQSVAPGPLQGHCPGHGHHLRHRHR